MILDDCGDYVVVINAKYITVSGDKLESKIYHSHSGYPGGKKEVPLWKLREKNPQKVIKYRIYTAIIYINRSSKVQFRECYREINFEGNGLTGF